MTSLIMVVDDDDDTRDNVCTLLEARGYQPLPMRDGAPAMEHMQGADRLPDLIMLDLQMPIMDGRSFRRAQLAVPRLASIPVVAVTASRDLAGLEVDEVVFKPYTPEGILDVVARRIARPAPGAAVVAAVESLLAGVQGPLADAQRAALEALRRDALRLRDGREGLPNLEQLRPVLDALPWLVSLVDRDERYRFVNAAYETWNRRPREEILGRTLREVVGEATYAKLRGNVAAALSGRTVRFGITIPAMGRPCDVRGFYVPYTVDGKVQGMVAFVTEDRLLRAIHQAPLPILLFDEDEKIVVLSEAWLTITGRDDSPRTLAELTDTFGKSGPAVLEELRDIIRTEAPRREGELAIHLRDGRPREWSYVASSLGIMRSERRQFLILCTDVTERKQADARLRASEERYRNVFEAANVSILEEDFTAIQAFMVERLRPHGPDLRAFLDAHPEVVGEAASLIKVLDANPAAVHMLGAASKEELLCSLDQIFLPESATAFKEALLALASGARHVSVEAPHRTLRGQRIDVSVNITFPTPGAPYDRVHVSLMDISAQKRVAAERERRVAEMERTLRFSEIFIGVLGHDLRNPLSSIVTSAQLVGRRDQESARGALDRILKSAWRMSRMIDQLLDFTRIRLGRGLPVEPKLTNLGELCRAVLDELEASHACDIRYEQAGDLNGRWDRDRLSQLVSNLGGNACEHRTGEAPIHVRVDGRDDAIVTLEVHNDGVVPADLLPIVFEPFLRGAVSGGGRREGTRGLGLGLYIGREVVLAHGGAIRITSEQDLGTTVHVELPRMGPPRPPDKLPA